jgi:FolB domain-containing protein
MPKSIATLDKIHIRDLRVRCIIGINADERRERQDVTVHITLHADLRKACLSDNIRDTVDYKTIKKAVLSLIEESKYFLVEKMASEIATICLRDRVVKAVTVIVEKPGALRFAKTVDVEITRSRLKE